MALCEVALSGGSDLVAKEMEFGQGWNSPSHTTVSQIDNQTRHVLKNLPVREQKKKTIYAI